ncbi:hypothetical protein BJ546DRAFT_856152 [Cryomyces antarcticus]
MNSSICQFLRPCLRKGVKPTARAAHARFFVAVQRQLSTPSQRAPLTTTDKERLWKLQEDGGLEDYYPRLDSKTRGSPVSAKSFAERYAGLAANEVNKDETCTVYGRVSSYRFAGSRLVFFDLRDGQTTMQGFCNFGVLKKAGVPQDQWDRFKRLLRRGDWFSITGHPTRTSAGELSVLATQIPQTISLALHQIPPGLDPETRARHRHVDLIVNEKAGDTLRLRHHIEKYLCNFLDDRDFVKVNTPLLTAGAGGAVARPFETKATELADTTLNLRIAPELWLKRLVVGNMGRVYELGPAFRNEGVDATHNPEFTILEFYMPFANLEDLISMTEDMFCGLAETVRSLVQTSLTSLPPLDTDFQPPFKRLEFIPSLNAAIQSTHPSLALPNLASSTTHSDLLALFTALHLLIPAAATLPRLLDALCAHYLEPQCTAPTFITHPPAALSPLSKSFLDPATGQLVAARAELFVARREFVNCYEEENSPFAQRAKLEAQLAFRRTDGEGDGRSGVDEAYLEALEWGLPPTGGWGLGIERAVMLFAGQKRIGDVLSFGTLRNVAALGPGKGREKRREGARGVGGEGEAIADSNWTTRDFRVVGRGARDTDDKGSV